MSEPDMFGAPEVDVVMVINEVRRELEMRQQLYPRWIERDKISQRDADHRIACMAKAIELLEAHG